MWTFLNTRLRLFEPLYVCRPLGQELNFNSSGALSGTWTFFSCVLSQSNTMVRPRAEWLWLDSDTSSESFFLFSWEKFWGVFKFPQNFFGEFYHCLTHSLFWGCERCDLTATMYNNQRSSNNMSSASQSQRSSNQTTKRTVTTRTTRGPTTITRTGGPVKRVRTSVLILVWQTFSSVLVYRETFLQVSWFGFEPITTISKVPQVVCNMVTLLAQQ